MGCLITKKNLINWLENWFIENPDKWVSWDVIRDDIRNFSERGLGYDFTGTQICSRLGLMCRRGFLERRTHSRYRQAGYGGEATIYAYKPLNEPDGTPIPQE